MIALLDRAGFCVAIALQALNFVSSLALVPAGLDRRVYSVGKTVNHLYSHIDILPTLLEMLEIDNVRYYGKSF